jgi:hydroxyethylthiazole kinase-like uncharacterized protein yjeF
MERIDTRATAIALHGLATSRELENEALAELPAGTLVARAGTALGRLGLALAPHAAMVWIAAGNGNNGADGLHAAIWLAKSGKQVIVTIQPEAKRSADCSNALDRAIAAGIDIRSQPPTLQRRDLAIDALLGLGASRAPEGFIADCVVHMTRQPALVLAADLPTGLDADTGQPFSDLCVRAAHTLSLLTLHPSLFTGRGRDFAGIAWFEGLDADLGDSVIARRAACADARLSSSADVLAALPARSHAQHKGSFGDVAVIGGQPGMIGAALLAARAAHAAGAGRVYVSLLDRDALQFDGARPELMFRRDWWLGDADMLKAATVVCGCGGGDAVADALPPLLRGAGRLVLDADALNAIAADEKLQALLQARTDALLPTVLTPHPLEAARLSGVDTASIQADRLQAARRLADRYSCVVVLKGSGSIIAAPGATSIINKTGNAALGTAGTGDVLAGWLGGLWAQQARDADAAASALTSAVAAVFMHGEAADVAATPTLCAGDLIERLIERRNARG